MDITNNPPVILSLCSGMCGIERGIKRAIGDITIAAYVEIEAFIIENLLSLMEQGILDPAPIWSDLKTFPSEAFRGKLHGIIGGYPCQPFSVAGKRNGKEDPRHLWPYIQQIISTTKPVFCFFENVSGHLSMGFDEVYRSLSDMGYRVEAGIFTAEEVGAPHQRERLFILAVRKDVGHSECIRLSGYNRRKSKQITQDGCKELGDPNGTRLEGIGARTESNEPKQSGTTLSSSELGNSSSEGLQKPRQTREREFSKEDRKWVDNRSEQSSKLAYTNSSGSGEYSEQSKLWTDSTIKPSINSREVPKTERKKGRFNGFPVGPWQQQHEWEEPRTVKSGLGCTVNGYNARNDLLRMYGNGVVEQTAEVAWIELWKKLPQ